MLTFAFTAGGAIVSVRDIYALKERGERPPPCHCPSCNRILIARLGVQVAHHFAHQHHPHPCFGSTGEGELHISAKAFLQRHLQYLAKTGGRLLVESPCGRCQCPLVFPVFNLQNGDRVEVESWADPRRTLKPDVTIYRGGARIGFIEVLVTHACEPEKLLKLKALGVPLVEVRGKQVMEGHQLLDDSLQIPFVRGLGFDPPRQCVPCAELERNEREYRERSTQTWAAEQERQRLAPRTEVRHCFVHFFLKNGHRLTRIFVFERYWEQGAWASATLKESTTREKLGTWDSEISADEDELMEQVRKRAREYCRAEARNPEHIETYGGFKFGPPRDRDPLSEIWWDPRASRWIRVQFERGLDYYLGVRQATVSRMIAQGRFKRIQVKVYASAQKTTSALEASGVEQFKKWLDQQRANKSGH